jgi:hypothetical protein
MNDKKPAKTSAERQRIWKEKQIEKIGIDEFNKQQAEKQRKLYNNKRKIDNPDNNKEKQENVIIPKLKPFKKRTQPIIKNEITEQTQKTYISFIKKFYKYYNKKDLNEDNDIIKAIKNEKFSHKNVKDSFSFVNEQFDDIIKTYNHQLNYVYSIFARIRGMTPFINKINPYQQQLQKNNEMKRQTKTISEDKVNKIKFEKEEVLKNLSNTNLSYTETLIYLLTMLLPPRRYDDYRIIKIVNNQPNEKNDTNYNYYYKNKIYIYNSKSDTRSEIEKQESKIKYIIELPKEIIELINNDNEYLLGNLYSQSYMSKLFANTFYKIYGIVYNIVEIRRIYITNKNKEGLSYYEKKEIADAMNHSIEQQAKYVIPKENIV